MLFNQKVIRIYLFIILLITSCSFVNGQNDFTLQDINPHSDTYEQLIGPSYFSNSIVILGFFHEYWETCRARFGLLNDLYLDLLSDNILDVKFIGIGKNQYSSSLDGMLGGRILPWVQDDSVNDHPIWSVFGANQRDVFFLNYEGLIDTSFSMTPYNPGNIDDVQYLKNLILEIKSTSLSVDPKMKPELFKLHDNYPNPFNPITSISYDLSKTTFVNISIFDMVGRKIRTLVKRSQEEGHKSILWNGKNDRDETVSAGLYLYTITINDKRQTRKMLLLK